VRHRAEAIAQGVLDAMHTMWSYLRNIVFVNGKPYGPDCYRGAVREFEAQQAPLWERRTEILAERRKARRDPNAPPLEDAKRVKLQKDWREVFL